jgi:hypothetical protein
VSSVVGRIRSGQPAALRAAMPGLRAQFLSSMSRPWPTCSLKCLPVASKLLSRKVVVTWSRPWRGFSAANRHPAQPVPRQARVHCMLQRANSITRYANHSACPSTGVPVVILAGVWSKFRQLDARSSFIHPCKILCQSTPPAARPAGMHKWCVCTCGDETLQKRHIVPAST